MKKAGEATRRQRRNVLKAAASGAIGFAPTRDACGQSARSKPATHTDRLREAPADRGLWITWYDLPDGGRDAYFSWLHGTYLPGLLKRPGYLWAAHYASQDLEAGAENSKRYKHVEDPRVGS